jgi:hypothetical protein
VFVVVGKITVSAVWYGRCQDSRTLFVEVLMLYCISAVEMISENPIDS